MDLDPVLLARIQFAFTVSFHILFPTLTMGLAVYLVVLEAAWLRTGKEVYFRLYKLWVKIFALGFGMGVVSGIVLTYQFGTNWSVFSEVGGPIVGPLISVEVLTAFFVEAGFIGIMLFGWDKVGPRLHFLATVLVAIGTFNSAFWVLAANSWMQTPAGAELIDGVFVPVDWWAVVFNPSFPYRFAHMMVASYLTTAFVIAGVSAIYLLRQEHEAVARKGFAFGMLAAAVLAPTQVLLGDLHGLNTFEHQPVKVAAMEGLWETTEAAPFVLFAIPDQANQTNRFEIAVPYALSLVLTHSLHGEVPGLDIVAPEDQPPVAIVFWSFRVMLAIGFTFLAVAMWGLWLRLRGRLHDSPWLQRACVALIPAGFIATLSGWFVTEIGRQPWVIYESLRTADAVSPVSAGAITTSLILFVLIYTLLFLAFLYYSARVIQAGPDYETPLPERPEAMRGPWPPAYVPGE